MSGIGNLAAFSGLVSGPDKMQSSQNELATLERLGQHIKAERNEDMLFQEMEAAQYEEIQKEAAAMGGPDRERLTKKLNSFQGEIKEKIKEYGSMKKFMENGGMSLLKKGKADLLYSEEFNDARENQKNRELILKAQYAGKGNLIARQDIEALNKYANGDSTKVTFSGLKTEVDIPENSYMLGDDLSPENILDHGDNYFKVFGNWQIENPDVSVKGWSESEIRGKLLEYVKLNYHGIGSNDKMYSAKKEKEERERAAREGTEGQKSSYATQLTRFLNSSNGTSPWATETVMATADGKDNNYWDNFKDEPTFKKLFGAGSQLNNSKLSKNKGALRPGINLISHAENIIDSITDGRRYGLASSLRLNPMLDSKLKEGFYGENVDKIPVSISNKDYYNTNGEVVKTTQYNNDYSYKGTTIAFEDENGNLLTNVYDKDGNVYVDKGGVKGQEHRVKNQSKPKPVFVNMLEDEDGNVIYDKFNADDVVATVALKTALGQYDDITSIDKQQAQFEKDKQEAARALQVYNKKISIENEKAARGAFNTPQFSDEAKLLETNEGNRTELLKTFYMSMSAASAGQPYFTNDVLEKSNAVQNQVLVNSIKNYPKLQQAFLSNKDYSDDSLIDYYMRTITSGTDDVNSKAFLEVEESDNWRMNQAIGYQWAEYLKMMKNR